jgi:hypothetical protein
VAKNADHVGGLDERCGQEGPGGAHEGDHVECQADRQRGMPNSQRTKTSSWPCRDGMSCGAVIVSRDPAYRGRAAERSDCDGDTRARRRRSVVLRIHHPARRPGSVLPGTDATHGMTR